MNEWEIHQTPICFKKSTVYKYVGFNFIFVLSGILNLSRRLERQQLLKLELQEFHMFLLRALR